MYVCLFCSDVVVIHFIQVRYPASSKTRLNSLFSTLETACNESGNIYKKEDVVGLSMKQISTRDQITQTLSILGHRTAFNNEKSQYRI